MKRNTTLTLMMMLCSVAAAVAAPDSPGHGTLVDCVEPQQIAAVDPSHVLTQRVMAVPASTHASAEAVRAEGCHDDITAPYRRLHHGGMKLPSTSCADAT